MFAKMENEDRKYSLVELQSYPYRTLQQTAKSMSLPSNVKKVYLIQMIHAKKFKTKDELNDIVKKVKRERKKLSQAKKRVACKRSYLQGSEISSTSNSLSPPISITPKRQGHIVIRCSPENIRQAIAKYNAKHSYLTRNATSIRRTYPSPKKSDRILRSFNVKTTKNIIDDTKLTENSHKDCFRGSTVSNNALGSLNNSVFSILRPQNVSVTKEMQESVLSKVNVPETCIVKKYIPVVSKDKFGIDPERSQLIPATRNASTCPMVPAKRRRVLSGIYPIIPKEPPKVNYEYLHNVGFRRKDGKIAKVNALVQKRVEPQNIEVTVQDIINCSITQTFSNPEYISIEANTLTYSNTNEEEQRQNKTIGLNNERHDSTMYRGETCDGNKADANGRYDTESNCEENRYSVYYHKKIRGEQVRSQRSCQREVPLEERLPRISHVFSRFNAPAHDVTQPIYVQVSEDADRFQNYPVIVARTNTNLLENLYNFRSPFIVNQPLQQIPTTTNTRCVYSTPVIATAVAQQSTALVPEFTVSSCERDNTYYADLAGFPRICELLRYGEQQDLQSDFRCDEELSTSCSSVDTTSQDLGATVTIPEMVEDALELISQDGDYMESIGMDVRVQCVICTYVCPKFLLEYHLRKVHSNEIHQQESNSWSMSYSLGALTGASTNRVLQHDAALYVLAVRYGGDDCIYATLNTLTTDTNLPKSGSITIYNKVTGEPHSWEGEIPPLPPLPPDLTPGLAVQVAKLDLLPNSANLKLLNGELVLKSPTKVVVGQPDLNDIHVILFVKIFN